MKTSLKQVQIVDVAYQGDDPHGIVLKIGSTEAELSFEELWSALSNHQPAAVDPHQIRRPMRAVVVDRNGRPGFATIRPQPQGALYVRRDEGQGEAWAPDELKNRLFKATFLPLLMSQWVRKLWGEMYFRTPQVIDLGELSQAGRSSNER